MTEIDPKVVIAQASAESKLQKSLDTLKEESKDIKRLVHHRGFATILMKDGTIYEGAIFGATYVVMIFRPMHCATSIRIDVEKIDSFEIH